jgi:TM2 domain-containing membrane protein YozV
MMGAVRPKSHALTIILSVIIFGLGQIYLGLIGRGLAILIVGFVGSIVVSISLPFYVSLPVITAYWIWQIIDAYQSYNKITPKNPKD